MKIYKCIVSGDELFTDALPVQKVDGFYKVKGKFVTRSDAVDEKLLGANPSAEEASEQADAASTSGINVVVDGRMTETGFGSKKEFTAYFKGFVKALLEKIKETQPERDVAQFQTSIQNAYKIAVGMYKDLQFFQGESMDAEGCLALLKWETPEGETDEIPYFYFFEDAMKEEKV